MTVRVNKPSFNLREKLAEIERPIGIKGSELMRSETAQEAGSLLGVGRKNIIHNGDMRINQRNANPVTSLTTETYHLDRWSFGLNSVGTWTLSQEANDPPPEFKVYQRVALTSAGFDFTTAYAFLAQGVEGYDLTHSAFGTAFAKDITISFWVRSNYPGNYVVEFEHNGSGGYHSISRGYTIDKRNVWEYKTLTIPGHHYKSFDNTANRQLRVFFWIAAGTTYAGNGATLQTEWRAQYNPDRAARISNNVAKTNGGYFDLTGVQMEYGSVATQFESRSIAEELSICQRYFEAVGLYGVIADAVPYWESIQTGSGKRVYIPYKVTKRANPATPAGVSISNFQPGGATGTATATFMSTHGLHLITGSNETNSSYIPNVVNNDKYMLVSAEI